MLLWDGHFSARPASPGINRDQNFLSTRTSSFFVATKLPNKLNRRMPNPELQYVFKTSGVPDYTFVRPAEYSDLVLNIKTPGRGLVIEGPSGIGKTTAVDRALTDLGLEHTVLKLSARVRQDVEFIEALPELSPTGIVIVDDFHKLADETRGYLADYMKTLADRSTSEVKLIVVGINKAGENLIQFAHDLVNRLDVISVESNPDERVEELLRKGEYALNVELNVRDEIVEASKGSFYLAQMLALEVCKSAGILEAQTSLTTTTLSFESVKSQVWNRLGQSFRKRCERFCIGSKMRKEGRAPYLHILKWLAEGTEWTLNLRSAIRQHPEMRGSVGQVVTKGYLRDLLDHDTELADVLHFDEASQQVTVEDPLFVFYIRNMPWSRFASELGFLSVTFDYKYDFALSFSGSDRETARALCTALQDHQVEVFFDENEQHRILAESVEDYLAPIYQSESRYVIPLLSPDYPTRLWTKFESDNFRQRFGENAVIPIWFRNAPSGMFDESRDYGGISFDPDSDTTPQIERIADLAVQKLGESREHSE